MAIIIDASSQAFWKIGSDHSPKGAWLKNGTLSKMLFGAGWLGSRLAGLNEVASEPACPELGKAAPELFDELFDEGEDESDSFVPAKSSLLSDKKLNLPFKPSKPTAMIAKDMTIITIFLIPKFRLMRLFFKYFL